MLRILTLFTFLMLSLTLSAQQLTVSGNITDSDGDAVSDALLFLLVEGYPALDVIAFSDADGNYEFIVDLEDDNPEGCFTLSIFDCNGEILGNTDCYDATNLTFNYDYQLCTESDENCSVFIVPTISDSTIFLEAFPVGNAPFTFEWSNGDVISNITVPIEEGAEYCVTITTESGCMATSCYYIGPNEDCFVTIFDESSPIGTFLFAEGFSGTDEVEFEWSTGETINPILVFESGDYCVTMTDGMGCEAESCVAIEIDSTNIEPCFSFIYEEYSDSVTVLTVQSYGEAPYAYLWNTGSTDVSIVPDSSGVYCVTVTDAEGCVFETCLDYILWDDCGVWVGCDPIEGGAQLIAFSYLDGNYTFEWSTGETGPEINVYESGTYCVTMTDGIDCTVSECVTVDLESVNECFGPIEYLALSDSSAQLAVIPNNDNQFDFSWSNGETTQSILVTEEGPYCVEVTGIDVDCSFTTCIDVYFNPVDECYGWIDSEYETDSAGVLSVTHPYDMDIISYLWSTGETTPTIAVSAVGDYCVEVILADSCAFEACTYFGPDPWFDFPLYGTVFDPILDITIDADIQLFRVFADGIVLVAEVQAEGSFFMVDDIPYGEYIALATVPGSDEYAPTYNKSELFWEDAEPYHYVGGDFVVPLEIELIRINGLNGDGSISGTVSADGLVSTDEKSESRDGGIPDVNIILTHEDEVVDQQFTNEEGMFFFTGLPNGTYTVYLEIPGLPTQSQIVVLSDENPNVDNIEFISDVSDVFTNTKEITTIDNVTLAPNPVRDILKISFETKTTGDLKYSVVNHLGKVYSSNSKTLNLGTNEISIDLTDNNPGLYFILFEKDGKLKTEKVIKL